MQNRVLLCAVFMLSCGCTDDAGEHGHVVDAARSCCGAAAGSVNDGGGASGVDASAGCQALAEAQPLESENHLPGCPSHDYPSNPPSSGPHWGTWAAYRVYDVAVPRESLVHNLEHGAIVISYDCTITCDDLARARDFVERLPADPSCSANEPARRVILVPDPLLDVPIAASAWGFTLRANCFDEPAFDAFFQAHYAQGPEDVCADGWDFQNARGELVLPAGCR